MVKVTKRKLKDETVVGYLCIEGTKKVLVDFYPQIWGNKTSYIMSWEGFDGDAKFKNSFIFKELPPTLLEVCDAVLIYFDPKLSEQWRKGNKMLGAVIQWK